MFTTINNVILQLTDPVLSWLLDLPSDVALIVVGVGTGALLTFARLLTTDQDLLKRCDQDKRRLGQLIREAKGNQEKEAVRRFRATKGTIAMLTLRAEGRPLLLAILPIALLGTWCFQRLEFHAPAAGQPVALYAYFPVSAAGGLAHVVPQDDVTAEDGWVQEILPVTDPAEGPPHAIATWHLQAAARAAPYTLQIRYRRGTYRKNLLVGQRTYAPAVEFYTASTGGADEQITCAETRLEPVKLFGVVPGVPSLLLAPWLVAYFLIAVPSVSLIKRAFRIY